MKLNIPEHCEIRWQAALAVLEDLIEDKSAPFCQLSWGDKETLWEKTNGCGSAACFAGYIAVSPYCLALGMNEFLIDGERKDRAIPHMAGPWLLGETDSYGIALYTELFNASFDKSTRLKTLRGLEVRIKRLFNESTGKELVAPLTFWID